MLLNMVKFSLKGSILHKCDGCDWFGLQSSRVHQRCRRVFWPEDSESREPADKHARCQSFATELLSLIPMIRTLSLSPLIFFSFRFWCEEGRGICKGKLGSVCMYVVVLVVVSLCRRAAVQRGLYCTSCGVTEGGKL